tara:strand:+ start:987 stop:1127 length:141 start_codon:yes stop_codon:yes gene_type:complete
MSRAETIIKQLHTHIEELEYKIVSQQKEIIQLQELIVVLRNQDEKT